MLALRSNHASSGGLSHSERYQVATIQYEVFTALHDALEQEIQQAADKSRIFTGERFGPHGRTTLSHLVGTVGDSIALGAPFYTDFTSRSRRSYPSRFARRIGLTGEVIRVLAFQGGRGGEDGMRTRRCCIGQPIGRQGLHLSSSPKQALPRLSGQSQPRSIEQFRRIARVFTTAFAQSRSCRLRNRDLSKERPQESKRGIA